MRTTCGTGELKWVFHSVPAKGEFGADTWPEDALGSGGGVHNWSELSVDEKRGIVYIPFGTARFDFYGGNRHGNNLFGNSLVALDARTGKRLWHFQLVHHDLWDYDLPQAPKLLTLRKTAATSTSWRRRPSTGSSSSSIATTGAPLWPIEERPVPQTDVPGEQTRRRSRSRPRRRRSRGSPSPRRTSTRICRRRIRRSCASCSRLPQRRVVHAAEPPGHDRDPGHNGGANWGSSAVDPDRRARCTSSSKEPADAREVLPPARRARAAGAGRPRPGRRWPRRGGGAPRRGARGRRGCAPAAAAAAVEAAAAARPAAERRAPDFVPYTSPYDFMLQSNGLSAINPPWSQITGYDLNKGTILWQIPNGDFPGLRGRRAATRRAAARSSPPAVCSSSAPPRIASSAPTTRTPARSCGRRRCRRDRRRADGLRSQRTRIHRDRGRRQRPLPRGGQDPTEGSRPVHGVRARRNAALTDERSASADRRRAARRAAARSRPREQDQPNQGQNEAARPMQTSASNTAQHVPAPRRRATAQFRDKGCMPSPRAHRATSR